LLSLSAGGRAALVMSQSSIFSPGSKGRMRSKDANTNAGIFGSHVAATRSGLSLAAPFIGCEAWPSDDAHERRSDATDCRRCGNIKLLLFKLGVVAAFVALLLVPGLTQWFFRGASPHRVGLSRKLEFRLEKRSVLLYAPSTLLRAKPLPVVIVLHGSETTNYVMARVTQYHTVVPSALVVYPEMLIPKGEIWGYNASSETSFFRALPGAVQRAGYNVDFSQVFVVGHSSGGTMSLFLQNNMPDVFRAAAAVEAGVGHLQAWRNQSSGTPVMLVWNHNDPVLQEFGGEALYLESLRQLRRHDPAGPTIDPSNVTEVALPEAQASGVAYAMRVFWPAAGHASALEVVSWKTWIPTHHWASQRAVPGAFDAAAITWDFFRRTAQAA